MIMSTPSPGEQNHSGIPGREPRRRWGEWERSLGTLPLLIITLVDSYIRPPPSPHRCPWGSGTELYTQTHTTLSLVALYVQQAISKQCYYCSFIMYYQGECVNSWFHFLLSSWSTHSSPIEALLVEMFSCMFSYLDIWTDAIIQHLIGSMSLRSR